jgi:predicted RNA polymerase sigma factor
MEPGDHLFRHEWGRMVAALTRVFGVHNLALAEDVVQDAFRRALEVWRIRGVPGNLSAWLIATAKNAALDVLLSARRAPLRRSWAGFCRANGHSRRSSRDSLRRTRSKTTSCA